MYKYDSNYHSENPEEARIGKNEIGEVNHLTS